jgi:hypothetical protein
MDSEYSTTHCTVMRQATKTHDEVRLDVMCGKKDRKKTFFPFLFFTVFVQKCFERHWTLCREKKFAKSLGVLEG